MARTIQKFEMSAEKANEVYLEGKQRKKIYSALLEDILSLEDLSSDTETFSLTAEEHNEAISEGGRG